MDYAAAIGAYNPATAIIPDIGKNSEKPDISEIPGVAGAGADPNVTFKNTLMKMLGDVNDKVNASDQNTRDLATGATGDIQKVVTSVEEANLAMSYMMAIRTKLLDVYSEVTRMQV